MGEVEISKSRLLVELAALVTSYRPETRQQGLRGVQPHHIRLLVEKPRIFARKPAGRESATWWGPGYSYRRIRKRRLQRVSGAVDPENPANWRRLAVPNPLMRRVQDRLLEAFSLSERGGKSAYGLDLCVHGAGGGRGPLHNALRHQDARRFASVDLKDFFGSVSLPLVDAAIAAIGAPKGYRWSPGAARFITRACTLSGSLPQGAPTSPLLANLAFRDIDQVLKTEAEARGYRYTRYFDDLCFSTEDGKETASDLRRWMLETVEQALQETPFRINPEKTAHGTRGSFQVTGFNIEKRGLRPTRRVRHWIKTLEGFAGESKADLAGALRAFEARAGLPEADLGLLAQQELQEEDRFRACRERWFDTLDELGASILLDGEEDPDLGLWDAARLLASRECLQSPEFESYRDRVIRWRPDADTGWRILQDRSGELCRLLELDPNLGAADRVLAFFRHLQGLRSYLVLEENGQRVGAVFDHGRLASIIERLFRSPGDAGLPPIDRAAIAGAKVSPQNEISKLLEQLDQTFRRIEARHLGHGVAIGSSVIREPVRDGVALGDWAKGVASRLERLGCDWIPKSTGEDALEGWCTPDWSSGSLQVRLLADWLERRRLGSHEWSRVSPPPRDKFSLAKHLDGEGTLLQDLGSAGSRYWQERWASSLVKQLEVWDYFMARTKAGGFSFEQPYLDRRVGSDGAWDSVRAQHERLVALGVLNSDQRTEMEIKEVLQGRPPRWGSLYELAKELSIWTIENEGPIRKQVREEATRDIAGWTSPMVDNFENAQFRSELAGRVEGEKPDPIGADLWNLRKLDAHNSIGQDVERLRKTLRRTMSSLGRAMPPSFPDGELTKGAIDEHLPLEPVEYWDLVRVLLLRTAWGLAALAKGDWAQTEDKVVHLRERLLKEQNVSRKERGESM